LVSIPIFVGMLPVSRLLCNAIVVTYPLVQFTPLQPQYLGSREVQSQPGPPLSATFNAHRPCKSVEGEKGLADGERVLTVGLADGLNDGFTVGCLVGFEVGINVGRRVGFEVGIAVGRLVGFEVGIAVGTVEGSAVLVKTTVAFEIRTFPVVVLVVMNFSYTISPIAFILPYFTLDFEGGEFNWAD